MFDEPDRPLVVLCSGNHLLTHKQDAEAHLARHLTSFANVLFVDPPVSLPGARRRPELLATVEGPPLRRISPRLALLTPLVAPKPFTRITAPFTAATVRRTLRRTVGLFAADDVTMITTWPFCDVSGALPGARTVYWRTDDPVAAASLWRLDRSMLRRGDARLLDRSDIVATVDVGATVHLRVEGVDARFLPNGCDTTTMARTGEVEPSPVVDLPSPIAGFVGVLNDRTDLALLEGVADLGLSLLVVGPLQPGLADERIAALRRRRQVQFVGSVPFEALPSYLSHVDVGLVPYTDSGFNRASFPLKAMEYLAAGRPVVGTHLPALRWLADDLASVATRVDEPSADLRLANEPASFARAAADLARHGTGHDVERRRRLARRHDWSTRAGLVADWCGLRASANHHDDVSDRSADPPDGPPAEPPDGRWS